MVLPVLFGIKKKKMENIILIYEMQILKTIISTYQEREFVLKKCSNHLINNV